MDDIGEVEYLDYKGRKIKITLIELARGQWLGAAEVPGLIVPSGRGVFIAKSDSRDYAVDLAKKVIDAQK